MLSYDALLEVARGRDEPQRLLFIFSRKESREGGVILDAHPDFSIAPVVYIDKTLDELSTFDALVEETRQIDLDWHIVFVAGLVGNEGEMPSPEEADQRMQSMVKSIQQGMISKFAVYDQKGNPVNLARQAKAFSGKVDPVFRPKTRQN